MFRKLALKSSVWHKPDIEFEWDPDARAVRGRDASIVLDLALDAVRAGEVVSHPFPTAYVTHNPLKNPSEMAAVLGQYWVLPADLVALLPKQEEDEAPTLTDADGKITPVQILH